MVHKLWTMASHMNHKSSQEELVESIPRGTVGRTNLEYQVSLSRSESVLLAIISS